MGADGDDGAAELAEARRPGARREHHAAGLDAAAGGADARRPSVLERHQGRGLEDAHAAPQRHAAQPAGEQRRLDRGGVADVQPAQRQRRAAPAPQPVRAELRDPVARAVGPAGGDDLVPGAELRRPGRGQQVAGVAVVAVDVVRGGEGSDPLDGRRDLPRQPHAVLGAEVGDQPRQLVPPASRPAAVAPRCAGTAGLLLEQHDVQRRIALRELERRPEAREPAADDADVGPRGPRQRRARGAGIERQRFLQPEDRARGGRVGEARHRRDQPASNQAAAMASTCRWSVPQQPPSTRERRAVRSRSRA